MKTENFEIYTNFWENFKKLIRDFWVEYILKLWRCERIFGMKIKLKLIFIFIILLVLAINYVAPILALEEIEGNDLFID